MPFVNIKLVEKTLTDAQKSDMIQKVTDAVVSVEGENLRPYTWVALEEVLSGDWGIAGKGLTSDGVKALAAGKAS